MSSKIFAVTPISISIIVAVMVYFIVSVIGIIMMPPSGDMIRDASGLKSYLEREAARCSAVQDKVPEIGIHVGQTGRMKVKVYVKYGTLDSVDTAVIYNTYKEYIQRWKESKDFNKRISIYVVTDAD